MRTALVNGRLLMGAEFVSGRTLLVSGARIEALVDPKDPRCAGAATVDLAGQLLLPGLMEKSAGSERSFSGLKAYQLKPAAASSVKHSAKRKMLLIHDHIRLRVYP